jgi:hypothetical protein
MPQSLALEPRYALTAIAAPPGRQTSENAAQAKSADTPHTRGGRERAWDIGPGCYVGLSRILHVDF